jgi:hypothetical protein
MRSKCGRLAGDGLADPASDGGAAVDAGEDAGAVAVDAAADPRLPAARQRGDRRGGHAPRDDVGGVGGEAEGVENLGQALEVAAALGAQELDDGAALELVGVEQGG